MSLPVEGSHPLDEHEDSASVCTEQQPGLQMEQHGTVGGHRTGIAALAAAAAAAAAASRVVGVAAAAVTLGFTTAIIHFDATVVVIDVVVIDGFTIIVLLIL